eukprot:836463-Rhodomonas_salina.1
MMRAATWAVVREVDGEACEAGRGGGHVLAHVRRQAALAHVRRQAAQLAARDLGQWRAVRCVSTGRRVADSARVADIIAYIVGDSIVDSIVDSGERVGRW